MPIEFHCQKCSKLLRVPDGSAGKKAQCPSCQTVLAIPAASSPPPVIAPPEAAPPASPGPAAQGPTGALPNQPLSSDQGASPFGASFSPSPPMADNPFASPLASPTGGISHRVHDYALASRGTRFAGALLDGFIPLLGLIPFAIAFVIAMVIGGAMEANNPGGGGGGPGAEGFVILGGFVCCGVLVLGIYGYQWYLISTTGQSIAKKMLRMRIIRIEDGNLPGFVHGVLLRIFVPGIIGFVPYVGMFFGLVDAAFIFGEERRCIHDHIAGTIVIEV